jgi:hypothetical protein
MAPFAYSVWSSKTTSSGLRFAAATTQDVHGASDYIPDHSFAATFADFEAAMFRSIGDAARRARELDIPVAARPEVTDRSWIVMGCSEEKPGEDDELEAIADGIGIDQDTKAVLDWVPSYEGPAFVDCDERNATHNSQLYDGTACSDGRPGDEPYLRAVAAAHGAPPVKLDVRDLSYEIQEPPAKGPLAVMTGHPLTEAVALAGVQMETLKDPYATAFMSAVPAATMAESIRDGPHLYISTRTLKQGNRVMAYYVSKRVKQPVVVNVWRRYRGSRLYVELDACPTCGAAPKSFPSYSCCNCSFVQRVLGYGLGRVGLWTTIRDVELFAWFPEACTDKDKDLYWDLGRSLPDSKPLPTCYFPPKLSTIIAILSSGRLLKSGLVRLVQSYRGAPYCRYNIDSSHKDRLFVSFYDYSFPAQSFPYMALASVDSYDQATYKRALVAIAIMRNLMDWLSVQPQHHLAISVLCRRFAVVCEPDREDFALMAGGFRGVQLQMGTASLAYKCRRALSPYATFDRQEPSGEDYICAPPLWAYTITVRDLLQMLNELRVTPLATGDF